MKTKIGIAILLVVSILASCAPKNNTAPTEMVVPASPISPRPTETIVPTLAHTLIPTLTVTPFPSLIPIQDDYLLYVIGGIGKDYGMGRLMFYDPAKDTQKSFLPGWIIGNLAISEKNQLAFSSSRKGNSEIYILDYPFTGNTPVNITRDPLSEDRPISWSPDGRYLAYQSVKGDEKMLSIWDGKRVWHIHQYKEMIAETTWSQDDKLAFTEFPAGDLFVWDGGESIVSISQKSFYSGRFPAWSASGQLAFLSGGRIFVWDGISKNNGSPDVNTFINVAPNITDFGLGPVWTNTGLLTFTAKGPQDRHYQIYEWNGKSLTNISQDPNGENGAQSWRSDGYWSFVTYFSTENLVYVRDEGNQTILATKGWFYPETPAWSSSGLLMFCVSDNKSSSDFTLSMWDGTKVIEIVHGGEIKAMWRNGKSVFCTNG